MVLGCRTVQITTAVMQYGYRIIDDLIDGLSDYLSKNNIHHLEDIVGKGLEHILLSDDVDRDTIEYPKFNHSLCVGCGRCYLSCYDGGHQALTIAEGKVKMNPSGCVGCQLCVLVCPADAITPGTRVSKRK